jgi:multimeric flavodoxin WrbA
MGTGSRIVAVNGSPRKANTDRLIDIILDSAREADPQLTTETIFLRKEKINFCIGCFRCNGNNDYPSGCPVHRDSMDAIIPKLMEADAVLLASPVYFGGVTAQMKAFMDRTESILRYTPAPRTAALRGKIGAAAAVGGNRNAGQEPTIQSMHYFFLIHDMMIIGAGPDVQPGCYIGAGAFSGMDPELGSLVKDAVLRDELGVRSAQILGRRIAETVRLVGRNSRQGDR